MSPRNPEKSELRRRLMDLRRGLAPEQRAQWNAAIANRISALLIQRPVRILGVYWPICGEPDLRDVYTEWSAQGIQLALPVVIDKQAPLKFLPWRPGEQLTKDAMGVAIPENGVEIRPDALLLPCVGFNSHRVRLGYGGGLYDRTLEGQDKPLAIGVAYSFALADFATEAHDVALDWIATEAALFE